MSFRFDPTRERIWALLQSLFSVDWSDDLGRGMDQ